MTIYARAGPGRPYPPLSWGPLMGLCCVLAGALFEEWRDWLVLTATGGAWLWFACEHLMVLSHKTPKMDKPKFKEVSNQPTENPASPEFRSYVRPRNTPRKGALPLGDSDSFVQVVTVRSSGSRQTLGRR